jgi:hypothetical protein
LSIDFTAAKFGACWKIFSVAFIISIIDALKARAALPSLTRFATIFHPPASLSAFRLSPSTPITVFDFSD